MVGFYSCIDNKERLPILSTFESCLYVSQFMLHWLNYFFQYNIYWIYHGLHDPTFLYQRWYTISKTLAEQAAWKFAKENGMDLVTIHPGFVIGPLQQPNKW